MSDMTLQEIRDFHLGEVAYYNDLGSPRAAQCHQRMADNLNRHIATSQRAEVVVSDETVELACRAYYNAGVPVYPPVFEAMRAALTAALAARGE
jgi:hypothetical protein